MSARDRIEDDALYPGHVVRRMLEQAGEHIPATSWLTTADAAALLDMSADWLRQKCQRWHLMDHPPVRVQKTSPSQNAHWRLYDRDVYALVRQRQKGEPDGADEYDDVRVPLTGDTVDDTIAHLQEIVTRNL